MGGGCKEIFSLFSTRLSNLPILHSEASKKAKRMDVAGSELHALTA